MSFPAYDHYKDSGVDWLGDLPRHWDVMQSRRMFAVRSEPALPDDQMLTASQKYGVLYQTDFVEREGRRVVEVILGKHNLKHVEPDDFIISMRSFQGGLEWCRLQGSTSFHYVMVTPIKHVHPPFFAHLLKSTTYIQALRATTDLIRDGQELRYSNFVQVPLPVVPLQEQQAIAAFLDRETAKIDALVAEQERLIALLKEKRQAVISHAVTKGLNPEAAMKDSGIEWLGQIPAHWEVKKFKGVGEAITGLTYSPDDVVADPGVLVLRSSNVQNAQIVLEDNVYVKIEPSAKIMARANDILVCSRNGSRALIGKNAMLTQDHTGMTWGAFMTVFRSPIPRWIFWVMNSEIFIRQSSSFLTATINQLTISNLYSMSSPIAPASEQAEIDAHLSRETQKLDALVEHAQSAIILLQERRASLISAAVTGKIDVRGGVSAYLELEEA